MNQEQSFNASSWGFISADGQFLPIASVTTAGLAYASESIAELQELIKEYIITEQYEQCAVIRDELIRRLARI